MCVACDTIDHDPESGKRHPLVDVILSLTEIGRSVDPGMLPSTALDRWAGFTEEQVSKLPEDPPQGFDVEQAEAVLLVTTLFEGRDGVLRHAREAQQIWEQEERDV